MSIKDYIKKSSFLKAFLISTSVAPIGAGITSAVNVISEKIQEIEWLDINKDLADDVGVKPDGTYYAIDKGVGPDKAGAYNLQVSPNGTVRLENSDGSVVTGDRILLSDIPQAKSALKFGKEQQKIYARNGKEALSAKNSTK